MSCVLFWHECITTQFCSSKDMDCYGTINIVFKICLTRFNAPALNTQEGGARPKFTMRLSHHTRLVPHSTARPIWFYHPFSLAKIPSNYLSTTTYSGRLVRTPLFFRFHYAGTAGQKHSLNLKNGWAYWWALAKSPQWLNTKVFFPYQW